MPWLQLEAEPGQQSPDKMEALLEELGAVAVWFRDAGDEPILEPALGETPIWSQSRVTGLFNANANLDDVINQITTSLAPATLPPWRSSALEDKDWEREWMDNYHPIRFGKRLWIVPSWRSAPEADAINILLDPGLAFGTGTHETTALCLEWLDEHVQPGISAIDFGCGSGILAVAAMKLGAAHVTAVDNDPQALTATRANAEKNGVLDDIHVIAPTTDEIEPVDLLIANILALPLIELASYFATLVKPGGHIILSGILLQQADDVAQTYRNWFEMQPAVAKGDWIRLSGTRLK